MPVKGKWAGKPPYGYLVIGGKLTQHPDEAPIVRQIVEDYLNGQYLRQIATTLNDRGIPAPAASKAARMLAEGRRPKKTITTWWSTSAVRRVLTNPALVGWQSHNGRIVLGTDGEPVSFGEGILKIVEHARVLAEMERRTTIIRQSPSVTREAGAKPGGGRPPRYLLVGIARCNACKYAMNGHPPNARNKNPYYKCSALNHGQPCPAPSYISTVKADEEVMRQLRTRLAAMEPGDPILDAIAERWLDLSMPEGGAERVVLQTHLDAVRGRIVDLEEARYVRGEFISVGDVARWDQMMTRLKVQRDAIHTELEELGPPPDFDLDTMRSVYSRDVWEATPLAQRRNQLQIAVAKVAIASANKNAQIPARDRVLVFLFGEQFEDND